MHAVLAGSGGASKGAAHFGVSRQQLAAAGLSSVSIDQLYRCLFVYSAGFADTMQVSGCGHCTRLCRRPPACGCSWLQAAAAAAATSYSKVHTARSRRQAQLRW